MTAASAAIGAVTQKKTFGSGTTLIISNEEMNVKKIVKSLEESGLLIKGVSEKWKWSTRRTKMWIC